MEIWYFEEEEILGMFGVFGFVVCQFVDSDVVLFINLDLFCCWLFVKMVKDYLKYDVEVILLVVEKVFFQGNVVVIKDGCLLQLRYDWCLFVEGVVGFDFVFGGVQVFLLVFFDCVVGCLELVDIVGEFYELMFDEWVFLCVVCMSKFWYDLGILWCYLQVLVQLVGCVSLFCSFWVSDWVKFGVGVKICCVVVEYDVVVEDDCCVEMSVVFFGVCFEVGCWLRDFFVVFGVVFFVGMGFD